MSILTNGVGQIELADAVFLCAAAERAGNGICHNGIRRAIWEQFAQVDDNGEPLAAEGTRTIAAYCAGAEATAYVETLRVGDRLPNMPIFLTPEVYVPAPLESSYQSAWAHFPQVVRGLLEDEPS